MLSALIFDVDGTLAETERDGHRVAFNATFAAAGLAWHWDDALYGELLKITGGKERMRHYWRTYQPDSMHSDDAEERILALHQDKNRRYAEIVASGSVPLRPGVKQLIEQAQQANLDLAIATTTSHENVAALLGAGLGPDWPSVFPVVVAGDDVPAKKPAPDVYLKALQHLGHKPETCLALEDSQAGLAAALAAKIPCVVTRGIYTADHLMNGALACLDGLGDTSTPAQGSSPDGTWHGLVDINQLQKWHASIA